ncbi:MAG TPA: DUF357 domain-containing protein [Methanoregulaceae archaeon]|nr:DUF357 domain-containing protein [Methanoregulaceae archaeon]
MTIEQCRDELGWRVGTIRICVPEGSMLSGPAGEIHEMVMAYKTDGENFERSGDLINALASYAYALGWLDAGCCIGLIETAWPDRTWFGRTLHVPGHLQEKLDEKITRYELLLQDACDAVKPVPDRGSVLHSGSERIGMVALLFLVWGKICRKERRDFDALLCFSYGFAWLDAGIRAGLLCARKNRHIFTI